MENKIIYIAIIIAVVGFGVGITVARRGTETTRDNLRAAQSRAVDIGKQLDIAKAEYLVLAEQLDRSREIAERATDRVDELTVQLDLERGELRDLAKSIELNDSSVKRIKIIIAEGAGIVSIITEKELER